MSDLSAGAGTVAAVPDRAPIREAYSINGAAFALGFCRDTIAKLIKTGALRAVKIGGVTRIPREEIERVLREAK